MMYEVRTSTLRPGAVGHWVSQFCEALPQRAKLSELGGLWHTDIGPLNEVVEIWPYQTPADWVGVRARVAQGTGWPPDVGDAVLHVDAQVFTPAPFSPRLGGGAKLGSIYEMRIYQFRSGSMPTVLERFKPAIEGGRLALSPLAVMMYSDTGGSDVLMHLWPYESYAERASVRAKTKALDTWPPDIGEFLLSQQNKILLPAPCSPTA